MGELFKSLALVPRSVRYKLLLAFCLMSLIPLLICVYLANNYIFPQVESMGQVSLILVISIVVALLGLKLAREIVDPIVRIALQAKGVVNGEVHEIQLETRADEIGDLSESLNQMTRRIRENMEELRSYGEKTKEINLEVNKKVLALSNLLQVGNLISSGGELKEVFQYVVEKVSQIEEGSRSFLLLLDEETKELTIAAHYDMPDEFLSQGKIKLGTGVLGNAVLDRKGFKWDSKDHSVLKGSEGLLAQWGVANGLVLPIVLRSAGIGVLGIGNNRPNFSLTESDEDIYRVFSRQIAIAIENDRLAKKTKELEIKDELTGLFNKGFIEQRLAEEIRRVIYSQRPCSFILLDIDGFKEFIEARGVLAVEGVLKKMAHLVRQTITDIDKGARYGDDEFAILLPEKNKKEALEVAERIRQGIERLNIAGDHGKKALTISAGISENPIDGVSAEELVKKAKAALVYAKEHGKNRVVGMIPEGVRP